MSKTKDKKNIQPEPVLHDYQFLEIIKKKSITSTNQQHILEMQLWLYELKYITAV